MKRSLGILALAALLPAAAWGQSATLAPGARVRVTSPSDNLKRHVTTVTEMRGDSIVVSGSSGSRTIALANATALDVSTGRRNRVVGDGLIGLGTGFTAGFLLGALTYEEPDFLVAGPVEAGALVGTMLGLTGLVVGVVIGAFDHTDRWEPVQGTFKASIGPTRSGGVRLALSRAF